MVHVSDRVKVLSEDDVFGAIEDAIVNDRWAEVIAASNQSLDCLAHYLPLEEAAAYNFRGPPSPCKSVFLIPLKLKRKHK
jgi:hypothetical protein